MKSFKEHILEENQVNEELDTKVVTESISNYTTIEFSPYGISFSSKGSVSPIGQDGVDRYDVPSYDVANKKGRDTGDWKDAKAIDNKIKDIYEKHKETSIKELNKTIVKIEKLWLQAQKELKKLK